MDQVRKRSALYLDAIGRALCDDMPIYALAAAYVGFGYMFLSGRDYLAFGSLHAYLAAWSVNFGVLGPYFVTVIGVAHIVFRLKTRRRLAFRAMFAPQRVGRFVAGTIFLLSALLLFTAMFSAIKTSFPIDHGFPFDRVQADIDRAIHFGIKPSHLLYAVAGSPVVLRLLEWNYNVLWFIISYFTLYWVVTSPRNEPIRVRYVLTWMICWIVIGNIIAGSWLSAGPAYYGLVTGDTARFAEQARLLATSAGQANSASGFQAYLWHLYSDGQAGLGSGISAFPSIHVAVTVINALFIGEISRRLGVLMWIYVGLIMCSSVYLGWHYAIDGYVSVICVLAIYWAMRALTPLARRFRGPNSPLAATRA